MAVCNSVYDDTTMSTLRQDMSDWSLLVIRERCLILLEIITDLAFFSSAQLSVGGSVYELSRFALLDSLYYSVFFNSGASHRPFYWKFVHSNFLT